MQQKILTQTEQDNQLSEITKLAKQLIEKNRILTTFLKQQTNNKEFFYILLDLDEQTEIPYKVESFLEENNIIIESLEKNISQEIESLKLLKYQLNEEQKKDIKVSSGIQNIRISSGNLNIDNSNSFHPILPYVDIESQISTQELVKGQFSILSNLNYEFILNILFFFVCNYNGNQFFDCSIKIKEDQIIKILQTLGGFQEVAERLKVLFKEIKQK